MTEGNLADGLGFIIAECETPNGIEKTRNALRGYGVEGVDGMDAEQLWNTSSGLFERSREIISESMKRADSSGNPTYMISSYVE